MTMPSDAAEGTAAIAVVVLQVGDMGSPRPPRRAHSGTVPHWQRGQCAVHAADEDAELEALMCR